MGSANAGLVERGLSTTGKPTMDTADLRGGLLGVDQVDGGLVELDGHVGLSGDDRVRERLRGQ